MFSASCLPAPYGEASRFIRRVVPEGPGGLNDPRSGWSCGLLTCEVTSNYLAFRSTWGSSAAVEKDIALAPGRYLLLADMVAESGTWGGLTVGPGGGFEAAADPILPSPLGLGGPFERVAVAFEVPATHRGPIPVRLHADGPSRVAFKNAVVLELEPWGLYLRANVVDGAGVGLAVLAARLPTQPGGRESGCLVGPCHVGTASPTTSEWLDLHELADTLGQTLAADERMPAASTANSPGQRFTVALQVEACGDDGCAARSEPVEVRFELASARDPAAVLWSDTRVVDPERVGLVLPWEDGAPAHPFSLRGDFLIDLVAQDSAALGSIPPERPGRFAVGTTTAHLERWDASPPDPGALELLARLGLNAVSWFSAAPTGADVAEAIELGLERELIAVPDPLEGYDGDLDEVAIEAHVRSRLALTLSPLGAALDRCAGAPERCVVRLDHPPRVFAGPLHQARFEAYLRERGDTPEALGLTTLSEASPLASWPPGAMPSDPAAARLHLRRAEFAALADAEALGVMHAVLTEEANVAVGVALGSRPLASLRAAADARGLTGLFVDAGTGPLDDCERSPLDAFAQYGSSLAAVWREAAQARGAPFALIARVRAGRADLGRVLATYAAAGYEWFEHLGYGPHHATTLGDRGGLGEVTRVWLDRVRAANVELERLEPWLFGARRQASPVVLLAPESDAFVTGDPVHLDPDTMGWFAALTHAGLPVDFMLESDVAQGFLEHPVTSRRFLVVTRANLSNAAWDAIERWVEAGNTLVLGPDLTGRDEFGQDAPARSAWLGVAMGDVRRGGTTLRWATPQGASSLIVPGEWREVLALIGTPIALTNDDRPVVVRVPRGRGRVIVSGVRLGVAYRAPELSCDARRPDSMPRYSGNHSRVLRAAMVGLAPVVSTLSTDDTRLRLTRLAREDGTPFVFAVPWLEAPEQVALEVVDAARCSAIRDELAGVDLQATYGSLLASFRGPAVLTWGEAGVCTSNPEPEAEVAEPVPPARDEGCSGGPHGAWLGLMGGLAAGRRFSRSRRSDCRR